MLPLKCSECFAEIAVNANFCPQCGAKQGERSGGKQYELKKEQPQKSDPATEKQLKYMADLGIEIPAGVSKAQARQLISDALSDNRELPVTDAQKRRLRFFFGFSDENFEDMTKQEATKEIDDWLERYPDEEEKYQQWKERLPEDDLYGECSPRLDHNEEFRSAVFDLSPETEKQIDQIADGIEKHGKKYAIELAQSLGGSDDSGYFAFVVGCLIKRGSMTEKEAQEVLNAFDKAGKKRGSINLTAPPKTFAGGCLDKIKLGCAAIAFLVLALFVLAIIGAIIGPKERKAHTTATATPTPIATSGISPSPSTAPTQTPVPPANASTPAQIHTANASPSPALKAAKPREKKAAKGSRGGLWPDGEKPEP